MNSIIKILYINWPLQILILVTALFGFLMLYSVSGGSWEPWTKPQINRFSISFLLVFLMSVISISSWRKISPFSYILGLALLIAVYFFGDTGMGAKRWLDLKVIKLQPSEAFKISLVMTLAYYYHKLPLSKVSHPFYVLLPLLLILIPAIIVFRQPDLGTALVIVMIGIFVMFIAGVHFGYFLFGGISFFALLFILFQSRGTEWQLLKDYHFRRIDTFLNPTADPLGSGYHITQSKIALGSGGLFGRGYMQGSQSQLNFLPEKHTDFIFTTLAEEFGFFGTIGLLIIYSLIVIFCIFSALATTDRYSRLLITGLCMTFFTYFSINIAMVMGLLPVVGIPLPLVSYGGSSMIVIMLSFGLIQSAHVHKNNRF